MGTTREQSSGSKQVMSQSGNLSDSKFGQGEVLWNSARPAQTRVTLMNIPGATASATTVSAKPNRTKAITRRGLRAHRSDTK